MNSAPILRVGEKFGGFDITGVLPAGGMGEVYRATDPTLRRDVVIKILPRYEPKDLERFRREGQTAARISHPNIVTIFDSGTEERSGQEFPYLVMEFIDGGSLRERLGGASKEQLLHWLSDVAAGLAELHTRDILHRDLKPENIMIGSDDRARIVDFGLAKTGDDPTITTTGTLLGTFGYFSPEQTWGSKLDYRSDIFSFGTVLHEALSGVHPFWRIDSVETFRRIREESPGRIKGPVGDVVAKCLKKKPADRYQHTSDLARDLKEVTDPTPKAPVPLADPEATTVRIGIGSPTQLSPTGRKPFWRRQWLLIALLATLVAFVAYKSSLRRPAGGGAQVNSTPTAILAPQAAALLPACGLTGSPGTVTFGESAKLRWSSTNAVDVVISPDIGIVGPNGSIDVSPRVTTSYEIAATNADGIVARASITLQVANAPEDFKKVLVSGSITATHDPIRKTATLAWNSFDATRVVITPSIGIVPLSGRITVSPKTTTTYTLTITNDTGGFGRGTAIVYVEDAGTTTPQTVTPNAEITCVAATQAGVTGRFTSDSTSCSVPPHRDVLQATLNYTLRESGDIAINGRTVLSRTPGIGPREGTVNLPIDLFAPGGSFSVKVNARNDADPPGEVLGKALVTLVMSDRAPAVEFGITPGEIDAGETAHIDWSSVDATALALNPVIGIVEAKGSIAVSPKETTTYTLTGISATGELTRGSVTLIVR